MDRCDKCGHFGHLTKHCWKKQARQKRKWEGNVMNEHIRLPKKVKQEEMNNMIEECLAVMEEESEKYIVIGETEHEEELITFSTEERGNNEHYSLNGNNIDPPPLPSDWLVDSSTTSHIANQRDWLKDYLPTPDLMVVGVGNAAMAIKGKGSVVLCTECDSCKYNL